MPNDATLAIIVPTYGRIDPLRTLLQSLDEQELPPAEVLLIDQNPPGFLDGQLPKTRSISITHVRLDEPNAAAARNLGFRLSRAKYVMFVDDDEWLAPSFTRRLMETFRLNPEVKSIWPRVIGSNGTSEEAPRAALAPISVAGAGGIAFDRDYFRRSGGYDELLFRTAGLAEDLELASRMSLRGMQVYQASSLTVRHDASAEGGCGIRALPYQEVRRRHAYGTALWRRLANPPTFKLGLVDLWYIASAVFLRRMGRADSGREMLRSPLWHLRLLMSSISGARHFVKTHAERYADLRTIDHLRD